MDYKTLAVMLFRILGLAYLVYAIFYAPYFLFVASYSGTFIMSTLGILSYVAAGVFLFILSKPLASLVLMGLDGNHTPPPPPPPAQF
jgi:hypothetical protein